MKIDISVNRMVFSQNYQTLKIFLSRKLHEEFDLVVRNLQKTVAAARL